MSPAVLQRRSARSRSSLANATENRYTAATYRVSPYIKGITPGDVEYELRNNNIWTNAERRADRDQQFLHERVARHASTVPMTHARLVGRLRLDRRQVQQPGVAIARNLGARHGRSTASTRSSGSTATAATRTTSIRLPTIADAIYGVGRRMAPDASAPTSSATGSTASSARPTCSRFDHRTPLSVVERAAPRATSRAIRSSSRTCRRAATSRRC